MTPADSNPATITIRCEQSFKQAVDAAAKAENRDMSDFVVRALKARMDAVCPHCGRVDRPIAGAGLSQQFTDFLAKKNEQRDMSRITISAIGATSPVAYCARLVMNESSEGMVLLAVDFKQGNDPKTAECPVPRGLVTGWQSDARAAHYEHLSTLDYDTGNDTVIRGYMRTRAKSVLTLRLVSDSFSDLPGLSDQGLIEATGLYDAPRGRGILQHHGLLRPAPDGIGFLPVYKNANHMLNAVRARIGDVDAAC